jgi:prepilin-type N-terminal cleavage/methylation domain-containing protein
MTRRNRQQRAGFTLIELLVVISIIAILMGLLISAVMKVLSTNPRTETIARMKGIDAAIGTFKADRFGGGKGYIPAGQVDMLPTLANGSPNPTYLKVIGPFRLRSQYPPVSNPSNPNELNVNCFEAQYIASAFGSRTNPSNFGGGIAADLDANQTLLFFLCGIPVPDNQGNINFTGFSNNPQQPFAAATLGESRKGPYLDNPPRKLYTVDPVNGFPRLVDGYGNPFAYFTAFNGKLGTMSGAFNNTYLININGNPVAQTAQPYANGNKYVNDTGYQIISAGQDKIFVDPTVTGPVDWSSLDNSSRDNLANFTTRIVGAGPTAQ